METSAETFFIQAWSEESLLFDLNLHIKIHQFVRKNSQNAGVNRAKKAYQCVVYTPIKVTDGHKPTGISVAFIHQNLEVTQIHVFAQLLSCEWSFA